MAVRAKTLFFDQNGEPDYSVINMRAVFLVVISRLYIYTSLRSRCKH